MPSFFNDIWGGGRHLAETTVAFAEGQPSHNAIISLRRCFQPGNVTPPLTADARSPSGQCSAPRRFVFVWPGRLTDQRMNAAPAFSRSPRQPYAVGTRSRRDLSAAQARQRSRVPSARDSARKGRTRPPPENTPPPRAPAQRPPAGGAPDAVASGGRAGGSDARAEAYYPNARCFNYRPPHAASLPHHEKMSVLTSVIITFV